jgi:pimeloyl-ACP methyl ester carboxylesterase
VATRQTLVQFVNPLAGWVLNRLAGGAEVTEPDTDGEADSVDATPLAVVFVHGIGDQLQGQTLVQFADPLARWFSRWLSKGEYLEPGASEEGPVCLTHSELAPGDGDSAQVRLRIGDPVDQEWLLAESWWAETFRAPKARVVLFWLITILPLLLLEQFLAPLRRAGQMRKEKRVGWFVYRVRQVAFVGLFIASLPLAGLGLVLALLLLVPMAIPIERVRDAAKKAALMVASVLGDCFILTSSPVQFDAMVRRVARDLQALGNAERLVVVAHSQGAALAYEAMRRYPTPENLVRFVTVGQGLTKLERVRELRRKPRYLRYLGAWVGVVCFYLFLVFGVRFWILVAHGKEGRHWVEFILDTVLMEAGLTGAAIVLWRVRKIVDKARRWDPDPLWVRGVEVPWSNFYSSADPVPNGPLFERENRPAWIVETEVWNQASVLTDHTSYVKAQDDFVAALALTLLDAAGCEPVAARLDRQIEHTLWRRWWRVTWLSWMRTLAIAGAAAGAISIDAHKHIHDVAGSLGFVDNGVKYASLPLRHTLGVSTNVIGDETLAGITLIAVVAVSGYLLLKGLWHVWDTREVAHFYRGRKPPTLGGVPLGALLTAFCLVTAVAGFVAYYGDYPQTGHSLVHTWGRAAIGGAVGVAASFALKFNAKRVEAAILPKITRKAMLGRTGEKPG